MTEEQIIRLYGKRCAEHCDDCCVCEVWAMHDLIETQAREIERLREALGWFLNDSRFVVQVGGNPNVVPQMIEAARASLGESHDQ